MSGLIWVQAVWLSDGIMIFLKEFFEKADFEKKITQ